MGGATNPPHGWHLKTPTNISGSTPGRQGYTSLSLVAPRYLFRHFGKLIDTDLSNWEILSKLLSINNILSITTLASTAKSWPLHLKWTLRRLMNYYIVLILQPLMLITPISPLLYLIPAMIMREAPSLLMERNMLRHRTWRAQFARVVQRSLLVYGSWALS